MTDSTDNARGPFCFDRYINGRLMAEGVQIDRGRNLEDAMVSAVRIAARGPNGEVPALIYRADLAPDPLGAVKVRALSWVHSNENWTHIIRAKTPIGTYSIHVDEDSAGGRMLAYLHLTEDADCTKYAIEIAAAYLEPEDMQSLCDDDFHSRIRSALEPDPQDARVAALVEKAQAVIARWDSPSWRDMPHTAESINELRAALAAFDKGGKDE